ncbi:MULTISPECIES: 4'-phosphopantetheinyl transferase family protein [Bacteroides]|jgi:4'-phosphopantetheinyl transferase|uniref:4'-phosphopantetheinyl transferase family protein n=1 Tax=Bacteroides TaxID=816 RepID=UPI00117EF5FF|nr:MULTISPECIES: 4'-phosphopantetheinyl transferase family protein [Bacteroides]
MALFLQHKTDDRQWAVWKMEESLDVLLALLPSTRKLSCEKELLRFASEQRKREWLSVRVLLYAMLQEDKEIVYSSEGKPFLSDHSFYISISHTKGYVAVILCDVAPVGIDIERYGIRVQRVFERFTREDEQVESYLGDKTWSMLLHWSAKETIFKRMNDADADLRKLRLSHFVPLEEGEFQVQELVTEQRTVYTVGYRIHPDFVLTWMLD